MTNSKTSPTLMILDWLSSQDTETQQYIVMELTVMGGRRWWNLDSELSDEPSKFIEQLRAQVTGASFEEVGLALCLRAFVSFAVWKQGETDWSFAERLQGNLLTSEDAIGREDAQRFFQQEPMRKKRWERVASEWRALERAGLSDQALDRWLLSHPPTLPRF